MAVSSGYERHVVMECHSNYSEMCLQSWDTALFCLTLTRAYFVTGYIYFLNSKGGSGRLGSKLRSYTE